MKLITLTTPLMVMMCGVSWAENLVTLKVDCDRFKIGGSTSYESTILCGYEAEVCCNPMFDRTSKQRKIFCLPNRGYEYDAGAQICAGHFSTDWEEIK